MQKSLIKLKLEGTIEKKLTPNTLSSKTAEIIAVFRGRFESIRKSNTDPTAVVARAYPNGAQKALARQMATIQDT
jgi:hypothetical protein